MCIRDRVKATLNDLVAQAAVLGAAQATLVSNKIDTALALLDAIRSQLSDFPAAVSSEMLLLQELSLIHI